MIGDLTFGQMMRQVNSFFSTGYRERQPDNVIWIHPKYLSKERLIKSISAIRGDSNFLGLISLEKIIISMDNLVSFLGELGMLNSFDSPPSHFYGSEIKIDILDEDFLQPYDYQYMIENNTTNDIPYIVRDFVESQMEFLQSKGVLSGHVKGEYI